MLELVTAGKLTRLLINVPPGMMKSLILNVFWPAWEWGPKGLQHLRYIGVSHSDDVSSRDCRKMRTLVKSDWYQARWPINLRKDTETYFENDQGGFREASPASTVTGKRGDRVLIDDPISTSDANSETIITKREIWFRETIRNRVNDPDKSAIIVIMQRLHERDTSGVILDGGFGYTHLRLPMEFEANDRCVVTIDGQEVFRDPRKYDGELVFPERFSREAVETEKPLLGEYGVAGQFQQRPVPRGGAIFKKVWFARRWKELPELRFRLITGDTASKTKEENDYSVFECWGFGKNDSCAYLIDLIRGKWESPELLKQARLFWKKQHAEKRLIYGTLRHFLIEDKSSGTGLIQQLRRGDPMRGEPSLPVQPIERVNGKDKRARALDVAPYCEAGLVILPEDAAWLPEFERELFAFPRSAHDDQVDPFCDAVDKLCAGPVRIQDHL